MSALKRSSFADIVTAIQFYCRYYLHFFCKDIGFPIYIRDIIKPLLTLPGRSRLRAATAGQLEVPRTRTVFREGAFSIAGPREWNSLSPDGNIDNREAVKRFLKTCYFKQA